MSLPVILLIALCMALYSVASNKKEATLLIIFMLAGFFILSEF